MGKRREKTRGCDYSEADFSLLLPCSTSDAMPCSSGFVLSKKKKHPRLVESKESKPPGASSSMDEHSIRQLNAQMSSPHSRHNNLGQAIFLKRSRHGHQHPWRNSSNNFRASTSHGRSSANWDERIAFKLGGNYKPEDYGYAEAREKMLGIPERIRSGPTFSESSIPEAMSLPCGICQNYLWKQTVVAVLVCGHLYHADCLEHKTPPEDKSDPPCPICLVSLEGEPRVSCFC